MTQPGGLVGQLVRLCQRGVVTGGDADELLAMVQQATGCHGAVITQSFSFDGDWCRTSNLSAEWQAAHTLYRHEDPSAIVLDGRPLATPYFVQTDMPAQYRDTQLTHALHDHGFTDVAIAKLYSPFQSNLMIALYRFDGAPVFSEDDRAWLELLLPAVSRGLSSRRALAALTAARGERLGEVLPRLGGHLFVSMPGGTVTWSEEARALLIERLALDRLGWSRAEAMVCSAVRRFLRSAEGARSQLLPGGLRLELACVPPEHDEKQRLLGWIVPEASVSDAATPAEELLTERQRVVARAAAAGDTLPQIAARLGIGQETVRTHLREVYARLGVRDRTELARLVQARALD